MPPAGAPGGSGRHGRGDSVSPRGGRSRRVSPFVVLSDPVRHEIVELLCQGAASSGDIATMIHDSTGKGWSSVSHHLGVLRESGFTRVLEDGPTRYHFLADDWFDLIEQAVDEWRHVWSEGGPDRELGWVVPAYRLRVRRGSVTEPAPPPTSAPLRSPRPGAGRLNLSERGVGRSPWSRDADGGGGFE
jgi:DNA-binding transcriptional ArsR family regulator